MDNKEKEIFKFYYERINNSLFDEKDIFAFLILIREYAKESDKQILEVAHLIAHRKRYKGIFKDDLKITNNNYLSKPTNEWTSRELKLKKVPGFVSLDASKFFNELNGIIEKLGYKKFDIAIKQEIFLCAISLMQFAVYEEKNKTRLGEIRMLVRKSQIELFTFMDSSRPIVCCAAIKNTFCNKNYELIMDSYHVFTPNPYIIKRDENKKLYIEHEGKRL